MPTWNSCECVPIFEQKIETPEGGWPNNQEVWRVFLRDFRTQNLLPWKMLPVGSGTRARLPAVDQSVMRLSCAAPASAYAQRRDQG